MFLLSTIAWNNEPRYIKSFLYCLLQKWYCRMTFLFLYSHYQRPCSWLIWSWIRYIFSLLWCLSLWVVAWHFFFPIHFMLLFVILQVDFVPNFDNSQKDPSLLPTRVSSLLLNGYSGIVVWVCIHFIQVLLSQILIYAKMGFLQLFKLLQVGMATNILHNLGELVDALSVIIQNPEATVSNLYHISLWVQYYVRLFVCMYVEKALSYYFSSNNY